MAPVAVSSSTKLRSPDSLRGPAKRSAATLTPRQREILGLVAEGRSNISIASAICITERAVIQHLSRIYTSLGLPPDDNAHRRVQAVLAYLSAR
jgi:DNA-binding NarL/FixJ family response regulator